MKVKSVRLQKFKRFDDLTINLGENPKKIVALAGPNGCGKSLVFDAFEEKLKDFHNPGNEIQRFIQSLFIMLTRNFGEKSMTGMNRYRSQMIVKTSGFKPIVFIFEHRIATRLIWMSRKSKPKPTNSRRQGQGAVLLLTTA